MDNLLAKRPAHVPADHVVDFDLYAPPEAKQDFHASWKSLHAPGVPPIVWTPRHGGHWIVTRNPLINEVISDYEHFSNNNIIIPKEAAKDSKLLPTTIDPPVHRPFRNLLNSSLGPKTISRNEEQIRAVAVSLIEGVQRDGGCNFTTAYAEKFPLQVFLRMIDLPLEDAAKLKEWSDQMLRPTPGRDWGADQNGFAWGVRNFFEYLTPYIEERTGKDGEDVLSRLINGTIDGRALTRQEALQLSAQVLIAGLDTVVNFLGFAMLYLATHAEARRQLVNDPSLIPAAIDEMVRRFGVVTIGREVVHDMEYAGVQLKAGDMVAIPTQLSGLDDKVNDNPMEVNFHRSASEHTSFGNGPHRCPGAHLARLEIRVTLEEWLARIPEFEVAPGEQVSFTGGIVAVVDALPLVWDVATTREVETA